MNQLLTPNHQLLVIFGLFIVFAGFVGGLFALMRQQLNLIERRLSEQVTPLWRHALAELSTIMRHPHPWAKELDELMAEANESLETNISMSEVNDARLKELLVERSVSSHPGLRKNENDAALAMLLALKFARKEAESPIPLTRIKLVGSQEPEVMCKENVT